MRVSLYSGKIAAAGALALGGAALYALDRQAATPPAASVRQRHAAATAAQRPSARSAFGSLTGTVARVVDGDSLVLGNGQAVRLLGVDAPELTDPNARIRDAARESLAFVRKRALHKRCRLSYRTARPRDAYGRMLAYVFIGDALLNTEIIKAGHAYVYEREEFARKPEFHAAERRAQQARVGLWRLAIEADEEAGLLKAYRQLDAEGRRRARRTVAALLETHAAQARKKQADDGLTLICWRDAAQYAGQYVAATGTIVKTYNSGTACFLNFHADHSRHLAAVIFAAALPRFPAFPERHFRNKPVRISGRLRQYRGRPEIVLEYPTQIEILMDAP